MVVPPAMAFIEKSGNNEDGAQNIQLAVETTQIVPVRMSRTGKREKNRSAGSSVELGFGDALAIVNFKNNTGG